MWDEEKLPTVLRKNLPPNLEKIKHGHYTDKDQDYPINLYLKEDDLSVDETGSEVVDFLRGKSILVTGATGFLGKLLVEKLLRCCKDIGTIYVIIRSKKGKDMETRLQEYLNNWIFVKLSHIRPDYRKKVAAISGDMEKEALGLSEESRKILTENVNIIYHVAATIRFDEKLDKAVKINVKGTQEIIKLAKECKRFDVFTHVSTAYSNCHLKIIREKFYPPIMEVDQLIHLTDSLSTEVLEKITPNLLAGCPNTYTFTKQITEDVVRRESVGLPACIQRPSIVIGSVREPVRSWVDNIYGPIGIMLAVGLGLVHTMIGNAHGRSDMVPIDYVINNCIVASYKTAKDRLTDKVQIFNFTSSDDNPLYWKNLNYLAKHGGHICSTWQIMVYFNCYAKCHYWHKFLNYLLHKLPGHVVDFVLVKLGKEPILTKAYQKVDKFVSVLAHFTMNEWKFVSTNTDDLWESMNEQDKKIFAFDMSAIDWPDYFDTFVVGFREFLLLEFLDNLETGRLWNKRLHNYFYLVMATILTLSVYFTWNTIFFALPVLLVIFMVYLTYTSHYQ